jgi:hypothetical protein
MSRSFLAINISNLSGVTSFTGGPQIDTVAAVVNSVTTSGVGITNGNGDLDAGKSVTFTVGFRKVVFVTTTAGTPTLNLSDGGKATYVGGSGSSTLTFVYTVAAGQNSADLAVNALALNGGSIKEGAGNNAALSGAAVNPAGILRD